MAPGQRKSIYGDYKEEIAELLEEKYRWKYFSSKTIDADIILTRDSKGFNEFDIRHITAEEFLNEFLPAL